LKSILLIDDEEDIRTLACLCLELETNWKIMVAANGEAGIKIAEVQQPDVILLDAMMPGLDGLQTLAKLQVNPKTKHIPAIFVTAKVQASDRYQFYTAGARGVITKPFDCLTLASQISGFLEW
jgi:CheY-like chemotaxis protein